MVGELTFFLGLQIKQLKDGIFINQGKYTTELLKKYRMDNVKHASPPMTSNVKLDQDLDGKKVNEKKYHGMTSNACVPDFNHLLRNHILLP